MDPRDFLKSFFGFGQPRGDPEPPIYSRSPNDPYSQFENDQNDESTFRSPPVPGFHFNVHTNPLEIHKFFDQQMDEVMKRFGQMGEGFHALPPAISAPNWPLDIPQHRESSAGSRDFMLKEGFGYSDPSEDNRRDVDLDGQLQEGDFSRMFDNLPSNKDGNDKIMIPFDAAPNWISPKGEDFFRFSNFSSSHKSIQLPDGSVERHSTQRSSDGHEKTVVTKALGDKSHTVTTIKRPDGSQETIENFQNTDEAEFQNLFGQNRNGNNAVKSPTLPQLDSNAYRDVMMKEKSLTKSLFDKFFS